ncbi:MAG: hypothetical protein FWD37_05025 [Methanomassiliicoccaceae archaeon]|nr:hypothetical protein [Methanomassiliicoccaceae archaeon]
MGKKCSEIEKEIDRIRLQIYEETKDLTPEQHVEWVKNIGEKFAKEYGIQIVSRAE